MKKLTIIIGTIFLLSACATPKASVDSINYVDGKVVVKITVKVEIPTNEQADSVLEAYTKNMVSYKHVADSANFHTYKVTLTSPPINIPVKQ